MYFEQIRTPGLGCYSYLIGCPLAGVMAVVDPKREISDYLRKSKDNDMRITHIFDTHVHADHISGAQELRESTGADIYIHESASVQYKPKTLKDGDEFKFGYALLRIIHTPGHTPNSISIIVTDLSRSSEPEMILTGDLLFVGDIGRPDLPGADILDEQVQNLYNSLHKTLGALPDYLEVYPAHGEGSLCGSGMSAKPHTTLGYERISNPMMQYADYGDFKRVILSNISMRPQSFSHIILSNMKPIPAAAKYDSLGYALSAGEVHAMAKDGATILDLRDAYSFGSAHIPGSISVDFSDGPKLNWLGVAVTPGVPLVLILPCNMGFEDTLIELQRIGYDTVKGWLKDGVGAWIESGRDTHSFIYISPSELEERLDAPKPPALIDVRTPKEYESGRINSAVSLPFDIIMEDDPCPVCCNTDAVIICQSGFRAGIAASLLNARGCNKLSVLTGGMNAWSAHTSD
jgi:glyoxylase-like metal-dependent hydrolase (beta-lactamase superfamily II)/rhodanese-related sulfurtransferase